MKLGLGLYRHMLIDEYYAFAVQAGCTHVIVHLVDYFRQGEANPSNNQPTGGKDKSWGLAGDPNRLWTAAELIELRRQVEAAGLKLEALKTSTPPTGTTFSSTVPNAHSTCRTSSPSCAP